MDFLDFSTTRSLHSLESTEKESGTITGKIIGAAIDVHRALGPGLLESAYSERVYMKISY